MRVFDASVVVEHLVDGEHGDAVRDRFEAERGWIWAPHIIDAEVGNVLRKEVRTADLSAGAARLALEDLMEMQLERVSHRLLAERAWELRDNLSFYDGLYVALAEVLEAPLVTLDRRLANAPGLPIEVDLVEI